MVTFGTADAGAPRPEQDLWGAPRSVGARTLSDGVCGICGLIQLGGEPRPLVDNTVLDHMTDVMTHRGPNDRGTFAAPGVALGVRRLSIVDVAGGHQPFANEEGTVWAIQNGELYNHDEIRKALRADGHRFASRCDTEILPHLFERDGFGLPERLRGKFGLAVWDSARRRGVVARDPLGIKPLYYAIVGDVLVFASELKSLLASGLIETTLDYEAIDAYLTLGYVPAPRTPLAVVSKLLPGHRIAIDQDGVRIEEYWRHPHPAPEHGRTVDEWSGELLERLDESVRLRLMSDVPLGAMLSGGLDSSLIVALMARHMREPVKTFSVGFRGAGEANELDDARLVSEMYGTDHHALELDPAEQEIELDDLVWWLDEPLADLSSLGFLALCQLAARHVTVALSGQGADELFGGYTKHRAAAICNLLPRPLGVALGSIAVRGPRRLRRPARTILAPGPAERLYEMSGKMPGSLRAELLRGPLSAMDGDAALRAIRSRLNGVESDPLAETLYLDAQMALPDDMLHYFDRTSMAHSLEVRVPFLDHHLVEFAATIPSRYKVRRLEGKHVLKRAARGLVPDRLIDKKKIGFFADSVDLWFDRQLRGALGDWLLARDARYAEFVSPAAVRRLVEAHLDGSDRSHGQLLLSILMLEVWLRSFLGRALDRPAQVHAAAG
jgi:asparagine synthase (glutamine-hydrolysing)